MKKLILVMLLVTTGLVYSQEQFKWEDVPNRPTWKQLHIQFPKGTVPYDITCTIIADTYSRIIRVVLPNNISHYRIEDIRLRVDNLDASTTYIPYVAGSLILTDRYGNGTDGFRVELAVYTKEIDSMYTVFNTNSKLWLRLLVPDNDNHNEFALCAVVQGKKWN